MAARIARRRSGSGPPRKKRIPTTYLPATHLPATQCSAAISSCLITSIEGTVQLVVKEMSKSCTRDLEKRARTGHAIRLKRVLPNSGAPYAVVRALIKDVARRHFYIYFTTPR